jgi:hypothetical protein
MADMDRDLALEAAIVTCYVSDSSGFPVLLRCAGGEDPALRLKAIAQLGDPRFRRYSARVLPLLLEELKTPTTDEHLERTIEVLGSYPSADVLATIKPFLKHRNAQVSGRARLVIDVMERDLKPEGEQQ